MVLRCATQCYSVKVRVDARAHLLLHAEGGTSSPARTTAEADSAGGLALGGAINEAAAVAAAEGTEQSAADGDRARQL